MSVTAPERKQQDAIDTRNGAPAAADSERTLEQIEEEVHGLLGGRLSDADRARWERMRTADRTGETCGVCGRPLVEGETLYRITLFLGRGLLGNRRGTVPHCAGCFEVRADRPLSQDELHAMIWASVCGRSIDPLPLCRPTPCETCERPVVNEVTRRWREHTFCSERCAWRWYDADRNERASEARQKRCPVCDETFDATRRDATTCSPACRQRAYRRRQALSSPLGSR